MKTLLYFIANIYNVAGMVYAIYTKDLGLFFVFLFLVGFTMAILSLAKSIETINYSNELRRKNKLN
jgi:hypothetical protein